jgi:hypothetical protein
MRHVFRYNFRGKIFLPNGPWFMPETSPPADHPSLWSADWRLVPASADWDEGYLEAIAEDEDPGDLDEYVDPDNAPPAGLDDAGLVALVAESRALMADQAEAGAEAARSGQAPVRAMLEAESGGRRGPGMPGSAESYPSVHASRASGFASGMPLDRAPGGPLLASFLEDAAGEDDRYQGACDDELLGVICGWGRAEASSCARQQAAIAEFIRRRPAPGCAVIGQAGMPEQFGEFAARELGAVLGVCAGEAAEMLDLAWCLEVNLPGTRALFRAGVLSRAKAAIIAHATGLMDPAEARAAEAMVLDRAGAMTPAQLRAAIKRAVMTVNPDQARKRREHAAKKIRVERWSEDSGNAGLAGRELPPAEVLAADQRVTAWARELGKAGLPGGMDALRARAYLDLLLGTDSRPLASRGPDRTGEPQPRAEAPAPARSQAPVPGQAPAPDPAPGPGGPSTGMIPPGFAGHVNLTVPAATLIRWADRPGELDSLGPVDPDLARDLAAAAARNPRSTWCVTVTDTDGHAVAHGCARPARRRKRAGHDPPSSEPGFTFAPAGRPGTWRFTTGQRDYTVQIESLSTDPCDHRHQARGHDPGIKLRHLTEVRHATCTGPSCRRPAGRCDFEHNTPYEAGGRTCLCNGNPKCRHDHRLKQDPRWHAEQLSDGSVRWTMPSGRQYTAEPTRYPI